MKTLELLIKKEIEDAGLILNPEHSYSEIAEHIERENCPEALEMTGEVYTPTQWVKDTKQNYPEFFLKPEQLESVKWNYCETASLYLSKQYDLCVDQTGLEPDIEDYRFGLESEDFKLFMKKNKKDISVIEITLDDILNYLLQYWNRN